MDALPTGGMREAAAPSCKSISPGGSSTRPFTNPSPPLLPANQRCSACPVLPNAPQPPVLSGGGGGGGGCGRVFPDVGRVRRPGAPALAAGRAADQVAAPVPHDGLHIYHHQPRGPDRGGQVQPGAQIPLEMFFAGAAVTYHLLTATHRTPEELNVCTRLMLGAAP